VNEPDGDAYVTHTVPTCARFDAVDMDEKDSLSDFLAACRKKLSETAPS
jgi:hypothetical protein